VNLRPLVDWQLRVKGWLQHVTNKVNRDDSKENKQQGILELRTGVKSTGS
jgi:hypothetical protein